MVCFQLFEHIQVIADLLVWDTTTLICAPVQALSNGQGMPREKVY